MVFIKDIASAKRESDVVSHREKIQEYLANLQSVTDTEDDLYRLRTISSNLKMLCSGKKRLSEDNKKRDREYQKRRYEEKKEEILQKKKDRRRDMRNIRESIQLDEGITTVVSGS